MEGARDTGGKTIRENAGAALAAVRALFTETDDSLRTHGLLVERGTDGRLCANVAHVVYHSPDGFEIGYEGSGPADLALAVMHHLLPPTQTPEEQRRALGTDTEPSRSDLDQLLTDPQAWSEPTGRDGVQVSHLAWRLHQSFKREFLADPRARDGLFVPISEIERWIASERAALLRSKSQG